MAFLRTFLNRLIGNRALPELPQRQGDVGDYRERFEQAAAFTRRCGHAAPQVSWLESEVLAPDGSFVKRSLAAAGIYDLSPSAGQCLKWCHYLQPYFERELNVPVWLTIGQLWAFGRSVFAPTWDDMYSWSQSGLDLVDLAIQGRSGMNLHAWLTVASGEIIEPTLMSSMAQVRPQEADSLRGVIAWGRDPGVIDDHRYLPMAVGRNIAEAIGSSATFPILARSKEDLVVVPFVGVLRPLDR